MGRRFDHLNWERLLSPARLALLPPGAFLDAVGVCAGSTVADIGAGPGYFTRALAERVGDQGRVIALDVSPEMVRRLEAADLPPQVEVRLSQENCLPVESGSVDLALLAFVLHELSDPVEFLREVRRTLAPGGQLVLLEWVPQEEMMGPPLEERVTSTWAAEVLAQSGLRTVSVDLANGSNYYLVAVAGEALPVGSLG